MNIIAIMVSTANGKTTRGRESNIHEWTSPEDAALFASYVKKSSLIVMGSKTYEAAHHTIRPEAGKLRVIMTRNPARYKADTVPDQLEFTDKSPSTLVERLSKEGYKDMLLVGGSVVLGLFFSENLISELLLTIEPVLFSEGNSLVDALTTDVSLSLNKVEQLNDHGTLHLHYRVEK